MDMQHFEIMVNAMLSWADESKAPRKAPLRSAAVMMRGERDELEDDDFEPDEALNVTADEQAVIEPVLVAEPLEEEAESELD
ncbi:hypothetical protein CR105_09385 [Massilia eurypsychrophila]|uniref:Uncharacterized protein n=1 Tax=Massilia eurypsychrophila TaxID=1485217 RepID=A0A2G8TH82_9BURK|nr:hypothetical protein [Massilia eurypsychrophila]PIL45373.1 hypothetical protein CR105_09385 [Massilia eurypsychrophila]